VGGRILDLLSTPHLATEALLPWLLNETLAPDERTKIETHLQSCSQCRAELERQRDLMSHYAAASPIPSPATGVDASLARLLKRINDEPTLGARMRPRSVARWWQLAIALQMGIIVTLGATLWLQLAGSPNDARPSFRGLADSTQRAIGDALVVFDPRASDAEMRRALMSAGARMVDGPTITGAFVVKFDEARVQPGLEALRLDRAVLRVESLAAADR
jgi:anti-sigma factor RsiW